jgi:hypothetical protein
MDRLDLAVSGDSVFVNGMDCVAPTLRTAAFNLQPSTFNLQPSTFNLQQQRPRVAWALAVSAHFEGSVRLTGRNHHINDLLQF